MTMKKALAAVLLLSLFAPALALAGEWTGVITDLGCGKCNHADHDCSQPCPDQKDQKGKSKNSLLVFYNTSDEKLYVLDNQALAARFVDVEVKVKGEIEGKVLKVATIEPVSAKATR
jgi:hypothetical protein